MDSYVSRFFEGESPPAIRSIERNRVDPLSPGQPCSDHNWPLDDDWDRAVVEGSWLLSLMNAPMEAVCPSDWLDYIDLQAYGWVVQEQPFDLREYYTDPMCRSLGLSAFARDWQFIQAFHWWRTYHQIAHGQVKECPKTQARYANAFNVADGVICAESNFGPEHVSKSMSMNISPDRLIPLRHWSDVIWLIFRDLNRQSGTDVSSLSHIFVFDVTNPKTEKRIYDVLRREDKLDPSEWPGIRLGLTSDLALSLLTTPKAAGIAWLLSQHKQELGVRVVDEVRIFSEIKDGAGYWNMYFHIRAGPLSKSEFLEPRFIDASDWTNQIPDSDGRN